MNKKQNSLMRFSRTERLAQLSEQEIVIERKKREIQAKLDAQKKKQTEETLRKLESSRETKKPGFSKNSSWSGTEHQKSSSKEKPAEQVQESLTNAFSNDGSFLDHFKKLSQTGLSANNVDIQSQPKLKAMEKDSKKMQGTQGDNDVGKEAKEKGGCATERHHRVIPENNQSSSVQQPLDSKVEVQIPPPGVVQLTPPYQNILTLPSAVDNPAPMVSSHSALIPQFQGGVQNPVHASQYTYPSKVQPVYPVQLPQSGTVFNLIKQDDSLSPEAGHSKLSTATLNSVQPPLPIMPQNIPSPSPIQAQNIPPPPIPPTELPRLRTESISMTLKSNTIRKLEAIPNPLEIDQPPSPPSPKKSHSNFMGTREGSKETCFNTTPLVENVSSIDRDSSRISSAFSDNEDGEEGDFSDERYHHWAKLVARCGDSFEDCIRNRNQNDANIRFLLDKSSKKYLAFRKLVSVYRRRLGCSEEPLEKTGKLNSLAGREESLDEIISSDNEAKLSTKSSNEGNCDLKECSYIEASVGLKESRTHSRCNENREDCLSHNQSNQSSELMSQEDSCLPSQKQLLSRDTLDEHSKEDMCGKMPEQLKTEERRKRKRKSRWGDAVPTTSTPGVAANITLQPAGKLPTPKSTLLSQLTRSDPGLIQYARQTFGSTNLSEEDWKKAEDHYKINLLYQDMVKKRAEVEKLERQGKFKYEYDSDEDTEGGTWEHKLRQQEMQATQLWAEELTRQAAGKHHIGDFLPPEELERFMEKYNAVKEGREPDLSDYKEYKLKEDNVGYRLLQKMGWNEGQGLGQDGSGITKPVNKATTRHENQGLGIDRPDGLEPGDDEYDAYRKRMMLAYRFRPNPLVGGTTEQDL